MAHTACLLVSATHHRQAMRLAELCGRLRLNGGKLTGKLNRMQEDAASITTWRTVYLQPVSALASFKSMLNQTFSEIYLDANATTPVWPDAAQAAFSAMEDMFGNPSSSHITGLRARSILETARTLAKAALGADSGRIVFTSGATEAIQTAIFSSLCTIREARKNEPANQQPRYLLYGATEHKAVPQALKHWNELLGIGDEVLAIPVDERGLLDLEFLKKHAPFADMVCTMAVNNETGVIHDLQAIERIIAGANPHLKWMVDCVQAVGKLDLNLSDTSIDYAPVSGHKIYGPKGIGLLYVRDQAPIVPLLAGGGQEGGARGGTENLPGVAAIASVLKQLTDPQDDTFATTATLELWRDRLVAALRTAFPTIVFNTPFNCSVQTTINFSVEGFSSKEILDLFDAANIRVSSGSACGSAIQGSYVLEAMGLPRWRSDGAIRLSFGPLTPESDIAAAETRIVEAGRALRDACLMLSGDIESTPGDILDGLVQLKSGSACSWVVINAHRQTCVVIDPVESLADRIETLIRCQNCTVVAILDTHKHMDHDSCRATLLESLSDCVLPSAAASDELGWPDSPDGNVELSDGSSAEFVQLGTDTILARTELSGHTADGFAYLVGNAEDGRLLRSDVRQAFTGDVILIGGIGRTDARSGCSTTLYQSIRKLPQIVSESTLICPTHDYHTGFATTLASELRDNPVLENLLSANPLSVEDFQETKTKIDSQIDDENNTEFVCGLINDYSNDVHSIDITPEELPAFFSSHENSLIVDVREPQEFRFAQDWSSLGLSTPPENVPLTRLADFLTRMLFEEGAASRDIIFLCRSGSRSSRAAGVMRRLGRPKVWHIKGGIALGIQREQISQDEMEYMI